MRRFLLVMVVAASATYADSTTSVSCTLGANNQTGTTDCSLSFGDGQFVGASAFVTEFVTGNQYNVNDEANVVEVADFGGLGYSATADANEGLELDSGGSKRAGFIHFDIKNTFFNVPFFRDIPTVSELITDGVHQYSYQNSTGSTPSQCNQFDCEFSETLPFDLGSVFSISTSANAAITNGLADFSNKSSGDADLTFLLLESDGKTSVPLFVTPEPSTWGLFLFGIVACSWLTAKRNQTRLKFSKLVGQTLPPAPVSLPFFSKCAD